MPYFESKLIVLWLFHHFSFKKLKQSSYVSEIEVVSLVCQEQRCVAVEIMLELGKYRVFHLMK